MFTGSSSGAMKHSESTKIMAIVSTNTNNSAVSRLGQEKTLLSGMLPVLVKGPRTIPMSPNCRLSFFLGKASSCIGVALTVMAIVGPVLAARRTGISSASGGRDRPPSLRMRQKCTAISSVITAGSTATCRT